MADSTDAINPREAEHISVPQWPIDDSDVTYSIPPNSCSVFEIAQLLLLESIAQSLDGIRRTVAGCTEPTALDGHLFVVRVERDN